MGNMLTNQRLKQEILSRYKTTKEKEIHQGMGLIK